MVWAFDRFVDHLWLERDDFGACAVDAVEAGGTYHGDGGAMKEADLAGFLGVSRGQLRDLRKKAPEKEGAWWRKEGRDTIWTPDGLYAACEAFGIDDAILRDIVDHGEDGGQNPAIPDEVLVTVTGLPKNLRILYADHEGEQIRVMVNSSENFILGMEIRAKHLQEDLYELVGRCPRSRGRW